MTVDKGTYYEVHTRNCNMTKRRSQQAGCSCVPKIVVKRKER